MSTTANRGTGTAQDPWVLTTPPGKSEYLAYRDETAIHPPRREVGHRAPLPPALHR